METPDGGVVQDRWEQLLRLLSARPRRQIVVSLLDAPADQRLPLPAVALTSPSQADPERIAVELRHHHLPALASADYIRWEHEPFCVRRGPRFSEPAAVMRLFQESVDQLPETLEQEWLVEAHESS
ncbi:hypothetical protein C482_07791 [Natrialba chahannaoensis JCM 10990]|uniref:ArsR family transcriptional regulator n=2 Tax=Natrialba chahannaoensis TaxID=68911 RepID=M0ARD1_9EURY|nr:hypothetical protein C482_07791 [Natrialba chahannaoensis JCM 10990]